MWCCLCCSCCVILPILVGGDDRRILLWNVEQMVIGNLGKPKVMTGEHHSNIFCLAFDAGNKKILSGGNNL